MLILALYLLCDHQVVGERIASLGVSLALLQYLLLYTALAAALAAAAFIPSPTVRLLFAVLLAVGSVTLHSFEWATGAPLDYNSFQTMIASRGDAGDAMREHRDVLWKAIGAASLLFIAIVTPSRRCTLQWSLSWLMPLGGVIALAGLLYLRGGEGARGLPAPFSPLAQATIMGAIGLTDDGGPREPVRIAPRRRAGSGDVVLVVDESIAANYLDIDNLAGVYSGLARPRPGMQIVNYGVAASITNCSAGSNRSLRFGGTRDDYRRAAKRKPSIWDYAHRAGLRTVYLDGQRSYGALQNLMDQEERAKVDTLMQLDQTPVPERDHVLARLLAERLNNGISEFILVNKVGAHFPVADKFPDSATIYRPLPPRGLTNRVIDMGPIHGSHKGTSDEWRLYRNAYRNTVMWATGGFFDLLLPRVAGSGAVLIYTSDHGQDLHERGNPGKATHCINEPLPEEGAVPLVVIDSTKGSLDWGAHSAANAAAGMSHFRIFPTLLALMGYPADHTGDFYGPTLISAEPDPMTFTPNYFAALGRQPKWLRVERVRLATPPAADTLDIAKNASKR